jgi:hypothetical protein
MGEKKYTFRVLVEKLVGKNHFEDLGVMGKLCVKWVLEKWGGRTSTELMQLRTGTSGWLL